MSTTDQTAGSGAFVTTRWTLVLRAGSEDAEGRAALAELCEAYWTPVFQFLRREGRSEEDSRELTQDFFARILSEQGVGKADPGKGRFRSYILGALKHFLVDRKRKEGRHKRGGSIQWESIHSGATDTSPGLELPDPSYEVLDRRFDRDWALAVVERALVEVESLYSSKGKDRAFQVLKPWLVGEAVSLCQSSAAQELNLSPGAVKVMIHRLRQTFRDAVRSEISQTLPAEDDLDAEMAYLIEVLSEPSSPKAPQ